MPKVSPLTIGQLLGVDRTGQFRQIVLIDGYQFIFNDYGVLNHSLTRDLSYEKITKEFSIRAPGHSLLSMPRMQRLRNFRLPILSTLSTKTAAFVLVQKYKDTCLHSYKVELTHVLRTRKTDGVVVVMPHQAAYLQPIILGNNTYTWTPYLENDRFIIYKVCVGVSPLLTESTYKTRTFQNGSSYLQFGKYIIFKESNKLTKYFNTVLLDRLETKMAFEKMTPSWLQKFKYYCRKYAEELGIELKLDDLLDIFQILSNKNKETSSIHASLYANKDLNNTYNDLLDFKDKPTIPKVVADVLKKGSEFVAEKLGEKIPSLSVINKRIQEVLSEKSFNHDNWVNLLQDILANDKEVVLKDLSGAMFAALEIVKVLRVKIARRFITVGEAVKELKLKINENFYSFYNLNAVDHKSIAFTEVFLSDDPMDLSDFQ